MRSYMLWIWTLPTFLYEPKLHLCKDLGHPVIYQLNVKTMTIWSYTSSVLLKPAVLLLVLSRFSKLTKLSDVKPTHVSTIPKERFTVISCNYIRRPSLFYLFILFILFSL